MGARQVTVCVAFHADRKLSSSVLTFMSTGMISAYIMRVYGSTTWPLNVLLTSSASETEDSITALLTDSNGRP